jgi:hypothetical protein
MPTVPISDLVVKGNDLVVATNGRSFWILDDLTVLRQATSDINSAMHLFEPATADRMMSPLGGGRSAEQGKVYSLGLGSSATFEGQKLPTGKSVRRMLDAGENPIEGVIVHYHLAKKPEGDASLTFLDSNGVDIKTFTSKEPPKATQIEGEKKTRVDSAVPIEVGMNRFVWDMRHPDAKQVYIAGAIDHGLIGPMTPPGTYQVRLSVDGQAETQQFDILKNPRAQATQADLEEQFELLIQMRDKVSEAADAVNRILSLKGQVNEWIGRAGSDTAKDVISAAGEALTGKLGAIEDNLIQQRAIEGHDRISSPARLMQKIREVGFVPSSADYRPTKQSRLVFADVSTRLDVQFEALQEVIDNDLPRFIDVVHELELPEIKT